MGDSALVSMLQSQQRLANQAAHFDYANRTAGALAGFHEVVKSLSLAQTP